MSTPARIPQEAGAAVARADDLHLTQLTNRLKRGRL
jgi:hypothetical protein